MRWGKAALGDAITLKRGYDLPTQNRKSGNIPVVSSSGITDCHNEPKVKGPGVITGRYGTLGEVYFIDNDFWPLNTTLYVQDFKGNHPRFIGYFLKTIGLGGQNSAGAVPGVNRNFLHKLKVSIPPLSTQHKIANMLSVYDDLIENNRRRIELLEQSARLLYREWFVRLRFPGHEHTLVQDGVPRGWEPIKIGELIKRMKRKKKINKDDYLVDGPIPCIDQSTDFIGGYTDIEESKHEDPLPIIIFGDHTRIIKFIDFPFANGADGTQLLYPNRSDVSPEFLYFALKAIDLSNYFYARHFKFLKDQMVLIPNPSLAQKFTAFAEKNMKQIKILRGQNQKLKQARDLLLPRLMSGEIAV